MKSDAVSHCAIPRSGIHSSQKSRDSRSSIHTYRADVALMQTGTNWIFSCETLKNQAHPAWSKKYKSSSKPHLFPTSNQKLEMRVNDEVHGLTTGVVDT